MKIRPLRDNLLHHRSTRLRPRCTRSKKTLCSRLPRLRYRNFLRFKFRLRFGSPQLRRHYYRQSGHPPLRLTNNGTIHSSHRRRHQRR